MFSGNFNGLNTGLAVTSAGGFTAINGTNVDIVSATFYGLCNGPLTGSQCIDMQGTNGDSQGQLQSNILFGPGLYYLSFDLIGEQRGFGTSSVTVELGNYDETFTLSSYDYTDGIVVDAPVTVTTPGYLYFLSNGTGNAGLLLGNVDVTLAPEPSSVLLMGASLFFGAVFLFLRRRSFAGVH